MLCCVNDFVIKLASAFSSHTHHSSSHHHHRPPALPLALDVMSCRTTRLQMATTYHAKLTVDCIKRHVCVGCTAEYQYSLERQVQGSGGSSDVAQTNAQQAAVKALEGDVDLHACPHCGMMQPDMVAVGRKSKFGAGTWIGPLVIVVALVLRLPDVLTIGTSAMIASGGALISLLLFSVTSATFCHLFITF